MIPAHTEHHKSSRTGWLRAAVLGANDGLLSTASLIVGVAAAHADKPAILIAGTAGLVAGALSMAAGEYVSVSSQADTEQADLEMERRELELHPEKELRELTEIYIKRGLKPDTALDVATQLTQHDALGAHVRDEIGITEIAEAHPLQAALASAVTFAIGALLPLLSVMFFPHDYLIHGVMACTILLLALLGGLGAYAGGAPLSKGILRVTFWGILAMGMTALIGSFFNVPV